ncbi:MAG: LamG-like jellyroll fold domain-containing protein [Deltaproteobacteria bacterium]
MKTARQSAFPALLVLLIAGAADIAASTRAVADDPPVVRSQAVVNLSFDEASGEAIDSATAGAARDNGALQNGAGRVKSPFWGQSGRQAVVLDAGAKQFVQIPDSPDVDGPDAVSFSMFFVNLHPAADTAYHGIVAKRDEPKQITNYGINYTPNQDTLQVYLNDGAGYKAATYSLNASVGQRRPVFITAVFQVGDAPAPDADEDKDDLLIRFYANGQPVKPKGAAGGTASGNDVWLTDVKIANLLNDAPLTLGASTPAAEFTSCVIDEFSLFRRALSPEEVAKLFAEVAGPNALARAAEEAKPVPTAPEISGLSLNGLTRGQTTVLTISGANLLPDSLLVSTAPIEKQVVRPGGTPERIEVEVTVPATAPAGHFPLRVQTPHGISGALTVAVDSLPQVRFAESAPDKPVPLPVAISGAMTGQQVVKVHFAGKAGQHLVVDLECKRLGSAMEPVLELRNPRGAPLNIAWGRPQFRGDTRIETNLFADGVYTVELHDLTYKAPGQNSYRLKIGDLKLIDTTYPSAVAAGAQRPVTVIGPGMDPAATLAVDMQNQVPGIVRAIALPPDTGAVGPAPSIISSGAVEVFEEPPADGKLQTIDARFSEKAHVPIVVNGRISRHGESDRFVLNVKPGATLNLSVDSYALHSPLDPQIVVFTHPDGQRLAVSEERPVLDFAVPAGTSAIQVAVGDVNHRGGPEFVYRLRIVSAGHPDFSLAIAADRVTLPRDGTTILRVDVVRSGYDGPIALALLGAPEITVAPAEIPPGVAKTFVVLSAKFGELPAGGAVRHLRLVGTSAGLDPPLRRVALAPPDNRLALVPGARSDLTAALTSHSVAALELGELPPAWFRGADLEIPLTLKLENAELAKYPVRLMLLTTEAPRTQPDPADPAKQRKIPIPLLRSLPEQVLSGGESTARLRIAVPLDVVEGQIDAAIRADFLPHAFSDKTLATVYSSPFRLPVQNAAAVQLAAGNLVLTGNAQTKFAGTLKRTPRFARPVEVSLIGLPAGYAAPKVTIAPDQEQFEIVVSAPAVTAAADLPSVQFRVATPTGSLLQRDTPVPTKVAPP